jgi:hypothetical protein
VNPELSDDALEFGRVVREAIGAAGGDALLQQAEAEPSSRAKAEPLLADLGLWDLDVRGGGTELEAAACACRGAGYWGLPYPVAERLARPRDPDVDALAVIDSTRPLGVAAWLDLRWATVTLAGTRSLGVPRTDPQTPVRYSGFACEFDVDYADQRGACDVAYALTLPCFTLLGMLDRALETARAHVLVREQFGQPLAKFQGVQFQLVDAEVERAGVEALGKYALWSAGSGRPEATQDALAFRLAAVEAAEIVLRNSQQVQGATGLCDESVVSWLSRYSQPLRRLPFGVSATRERLASSLDRDGLVGLYSPSTAGVPHD